MTPSHHVHKLGRFTPSLLTLTLLAACGGGSDTPPPAATATRTAAEACNALQTSSVATAAVSLPTGGVTLESATLAAAAGSGATAVGEYCAVKGSIASVRRACPPIAFQVNLPSTWNDKAFHLTGGGYDGSLVSGTGSVPSSATFAAPLSRGYTTFGSDSGHVGSGGDASFALDDEALENYFGDQLRKTRDVAVELMKQRYGKAPVKTYVGGGSGGGREALYVADRCSIAPANPSSFAMPFATHIGDGFIRYWVMGDPSYNVMDFSVTTAAFIQHRLQYISSRLDVNPDLSAFKARGGKLILVTGQADSIIPSNTSVDLYNSMSAAMGSSALPAFMRFYFVPGYDHGFAQQFNLNWDSITALENWVERGTAPAGVSGSDANPGANGRTRPLCEFPTWPHYNGTGDPNLASSFTCGV